MRCKTLFGAATAFALLTAPAAAFAAKVDRSDYVGQRLLVKAEQALFYDTVPGSFTGSLQRGQSFKVERLSPSGSYAYGFAFGGVNRQVYLKTSALDASAPGPPAEPQLVGTPSVRYRFDTTQGVGRLLVVNAVFRTDRALDRRKYTVLVAPTLQKGLRVPVVVSEGAAPASVGRKDEHCYAGRISQLRTRDTLSGERTWRMGLFRTGYVSQGRLKHVTLKPEPERDGWQLRAAKRLGC